MWLPTSLYERVPQFWFVLGLLFMISGTYLGFEYHSAFLYVGVGAACVLWSIAIVAWRRRYRTEELKQTMALAMSSIPRQQNAEEPVDQASREEPAAGDQQRE